MGGALVLLGILLIGLQFSLIMRPKEENLPRPEMPTKTAVSPVVPISGIVGAGLVIAGGVIFARGRHRDEPDPKHAVK